jgi:hypothetical protein
MSDGWWFQHDGERVVWRGKPRLSAALPGVSLGVLVCVAAAASAVIADLRLVVGVVPGGGIATWSVLGVKRTEFVLTTRALWVKKGVLGRSVRRVNTRKIQNTAFTQSLTGSVFGYGTVTVEVAGGEELELRRVDDPETVQTTIRERMVGTDGAIPGSSGQWRSVLRLTRAIRTGVAHTDSTRGGGDTS